MIQSWASGTLKIFKRNFLVITFYLDGCGAGGRAGRLLIRRWCECVSMNFWWAACHFCREATCHWLTRKLLCKCSPFTVFPVFCWVVFSTTSSERILLRYTQNNKGHGFLKSLFAGNTFNRCSAENWVQIAVTRSLLNMKNYLTKKLMWCTDLHVLVYP